MFIEANTGKQRVLDSFLALARRHVPPLEFPRNPFEAFYESLLSELICQRNIEFDSPFIRRMQRGGGGD